MAWFSRRNKETQQRNDLGLRRVVLSPLGSLSFARLNGLCSGGSSRKV